MRFAKEAWPFVLPPAIAAAAMAVAGYRGWAVALLLVSTALLLFFRDPRCRPAGDEADILAPAFGKVLRIDEVVDAEVSPEPMTRIVTFLSVFDVHVQRSPSSGTVLESSLRSGRRVAAFRGDAGELNEQHLSVVRRSDGDLVAVRQIVGLLARRIVCYLKPGDEVLRGRTMGLIKFGSRVDLLLPASYRVQVAAGDRLRGGETVVARAGAALATPPAVDGGRDDG